MAVCQNLVPLVNIKIAGKWMFIPLKMVCIGIDPYPYICIYLCIIYMYIHIILYIYTQYTHMTCTFHMGLVPLHYPYFSHDSFVTNYYGIWTRIMVIMGLTCSDAG